MNRAPWGPGSKPEHESGRKQIPLSGALRAEHLLSGRQASQERAGPIRREKTRITRLQGGLKNGSGPCSGQVPCARAPCSEHSFSPLHPHAPGLFFPLTKRVELVLSAEQTRGVQFSPVRKWLLPPHLQPRDHGTTGTMGTTGPRGHGTKGPRDQGATRPHARMGPGAECLAVTAGPAATLVAGSCSSSQPPPLSERRPLPTQHAYAH